MGKIWKDWKVSALKGHRVIKNEDGYAKFIFVLGLIVFLVYAGIQFGMPYYRYSAFKTDAKELARISMGDLEKTKAQIVEKANELNLPLKASGIEVTNSGKGVRVKASWSENVSILGLYQKTLNFNLDIEE